MEQNKSDNSLQISANADINPPQEAKPLTEKVNKKYLTVIIIVLAVLLLLSLAIIGNLLMQNNKLKQGSINTQSTPTPTTFKNQKADPTADWKTYNSPYGYSLKYPNDLRMRNGDWEENGTKYGLQKEDEIVLSFQEPDQPPHGGFPYGLNISIKKPVSISSSTSFAEWVTNKTEEINNIVYGIKVESTNGYVDNNPSFKMQYTFEKNITTYYISRDSKIYELTMATFTPFQSKADSEDFILSFNYAEIFNQILSTFKFTNAATKLCPDNYELFDSTQFSICYPSGMTKEVTTFNSTDNPSRQGVSLRLTNSNELINVMSVFSGGWGGDTCYKGKTQINGVSSDILKWDKDGAPPCSSNMTQFVAVVGERDKKNIFPVVIDYSRTKGSDSLNEEVFNNILNSLAFN